MPDVRTLVPSLPGSTLSPFEIDYTLLRSICLSIGETEGISGCFEYKTDLFAAATIARQNILKRFYGMLLHSLMSNLKLIEIFNDANWHKCRYGGISKYC